MDKTANLKHFQCQIDYDRIPYTLRSGNNKMLMALSLVACCKRQPPLFYVRTKDQKKQNDAGLYVTAPLNEKI